jgi:hypothetical protein
MQRLSHFLQYHNAVPLAIALLFLGAGGAFAATDPQAIYNQTQTVVSIDNTYLVNKDLTNWTPTTVITAVTEDEDNYYVAYRLQTIDIQDSVWRDVSKDLSMTVSKAFLGKDKDLGLYVTQQLKENIDHEIARLSATQDIEKKQVSQKVVATEYGGLVGKMLDATTETLPGYVPVVQPVSPEVATAATPQDPSAPTAGGIPSSQAVSSGALQVLGAVPALIPAKSQYVDLGAVITDYRLANYGIHYRVNGAEVQSVQIDTSTTSEWMIGYEVFDGTSVVASASRKVIVYDPAKGPSDIPQQIFQGTVPPVPVEPAATQATPSPVPDAPVATSTAPTDTASTTPETSTPPQPDPSAATTSDATTTTP